MCSRSPGQGHSYRLAASLTAGALREMPARLSTFQTAECAQPVAPATSRGPQPVSRRQAQIRSASSGASCCGELRGRRERSSKQDKLRLASSLESRCPARHVSGDRVVNQVCERTHGRIMPLPSGDLAVTPAADDGRAGRESRFSAGPAFRDDAWAGVSDTSGEKLYGRANARAARLRSPRSQSRPRR
jgi:hypothetical protein